MKNNVLIIALITLLAVLVIAVVIIASMINGNRNTSDIESTDYSLSDSGELSDSADSDSDVSESLPDSEPDSSTDINSSAGIDSSDTELGQNIVALANSLIGVPFAENGDSPTGFDNSGFIYYVLRENGYITCPRSTVNQAVMGTAVDYEHLNPGDLVFFSHEPGGSAGFGGIFIGDGKMIACLMPGTAVKEVDITTDYYRSNFVTGIGVS